MSKKKFELELDEEIVDFINKTYPSMSWNQYINILCYEFATTRNMDFAFAKAMEYLEETNEKGGGQWLHN